MQTEDIFREYVEYEFARDARIGIFRRDGPLQILRNDAFPHIYDMNHAWVDGTDETPVADLEARFDDAFADGPVRHRAFWYSDAEAAFRRQEEFVEAGYRPGGAYVMLQIGEADCVTNDEVHMSPIPVDHPDLFAVHRAVTKDTWGEATADELTAAGLHRREHSGAQNYIAEMHGRPVGEMALDTHARLGVIAELGTIPEYRNRGVGVTMLCNGFSESRRAGHQFLTLTTEFDNTARQIYERVKFVIIGELRDFLWLPDPV